VSSALRAPVVDAPDTAEGFSEFARAGGWSDGAPVIPPTDALVEALLARTDREAAELLGVMPPRLNTLSVELLAINAALADVEPEAFPLLLAAARGVLAPDFNLLSMSTSTSPGCPVLIVNGPDRGALQIDFGPGCLGGAGGRGSMTLGRAIALCLRNVGGQKAGVTSRTTFGQPARFGLCFGEWEERSPWPTLAQRNGCEFAGNVATVHGGTSIFHLFDNDDQTPAERAAAIGRSISYPLNQLFRGSADTGQVLIAINPIWAESFDRDLGSLQAFQQHVWEYAVQPIEIFGAAQRKFLENHGRIGDSGLVRLVDRPDQFVPVVCGGAGSLHAIVFNTFGDTLMQSVAA
jgi:hypothetical protein